MIVTAEPKERLKGGLRADLPQRVERGSRKQDDEHPTDGTADDVVAGPRHGDEGHHRAGRRQQEGDDVRSHPYP